MWILIQGDEGNGHRLLHLESGASITVHPIGDGRTELTYSLATASAGAVNLRSRAADTVLLASFDTEELAEGELVRLGKDLSARPVPTETRFGRGG